MKVYEQAKVFRQARAVQAKFWGAASVNEGADKLKEGSAYRYIADSGIKANQHHEGKLLEQVDLNTWITMSIQRAVDNVASRLQDVLAFLATVGSTAPFIGLFGTVWGIMTSFQSIAASKNTSLAVVAPGIAEALFATALGLVAAIPATIFYNKFASEVNKQAQRLEGFADEFAAILSRQIDERG